MNPNSSVMASVSGPSSLLGSSSSAKPKRSRRTVQRRPKALPATVRQRLASLGHNPRSQDTTDANLNELIEKLSGDLQNYTIAAQHWQKKLQALQSGQMTTEELVEEEKKLERSNSGNRSILLEHVASQDSFGGDMLARLHRTVSPTLEYVNMPLPRVRSAITGPMAIVQTEECFITVLNNISELAKLFGMFKGNNSAWSSISKLKSDFSEARARDIWADMFSPIDTSFHSFQWEAGPGSRSIASSSSHLIALNDDDDDDSDLLDRRLSIASDYDVVDMLHYCSLLLVGFNQATYDNGTFTVARDHLGKQVERLLREAIFTRNIGASRDYAHGLLAGILGVLRHFSGMARSGAVVSLLEIAWATCMQHIENVHPIMKGVVSFVSTVLAPSQSRRAVWMARNQENFNSTTERYFHLTVTAYFAASYYALTTRDDDALLHYLAQLDEILAPVPPDPPQQISGPFYDDPVVCWHLGKHPNANNYNESPKDEFSTTTTATTVTATTVTACASNVSSSSPHPSHSSSTSSSRLASVLGTDSYDTSSSNELRFQIPTYQSTTLKGSISPQADAPSSLSHIQLQHSTSQLISPCFSSVVATAPGGYYLNTPKSPMSPPHMPPPGPHPHHDHHHDHHRPPPQQQQCPNQFTQPFTSSAIPQAGWNAPHGGPWLQIPRPSDVPPVKGSDALFSLPSYHFVGSSSTAQPNAGKEESSPNSSPLTSDSSPHGSYYASRTDNPSYSDSSMPHVSTNLDPSHFAYQEEEGGTWRPYEEDTPFSEDASSLDTASASQAFSPNSEAFIPNEDFKSCLRAAVHLIRAEAALLTSDYSTCRYWVDEAEHEMNSVPDMFLHHKVFLVDVSVLKQVFGSPCPFPSGTRSVAEEFESRLRVEADRRKAKFPLHRSGIRGDRI